MSSDHSDESLSASYHGGGVQQMVAFSRGRKRSAGTKQSDLVKKRRQLIRQIDTWAPLTCCKRNCIEQIGVESCRALREYFMTVSRDERKAKLIEFMGNETDEHGRKGFAIKGYSVCWKMLLDTFGISRSMIANVLGLPSANASHIPGRNGGTDGSLTKKSAVIAFLRTLADEVADEIPNSAERHLPHGNKQIVYLLFTENERKYAREPCRPSHFYNTWKAFMSQIKCRRNHGFTVCDTCTSFKESILSISRKIGCERERKVLKRDFGRHLRHVHAERAEYRKVQTDATDRPSDVLSVIIDGADQAKFGLPRFPTKTKRETGNALKQKVTGVCFHGALAGSDFVCFFTSSDNIPSGANQTVDALCRSLLLLFEQREAYPGTGFPTELNIQLDNTTKDNKNRYFFAFCEFLVHMGIFQRVIVNFLPVGHTHEDIDRRFSRVSVYLQQRTIASIADLHHALAESQSGRFRPHVMRVCGMHNFSAAVEEQKIIVSQVPNMLTYRKFIFEQDRSHQGELSRSKVSCMVSMNMSDRRELWIALKRPDGFVGSFLRKKPDMDRAPPLKCKAVAKEEADTWRKRISLTETRIRDAQKVRALREEVCRIERQKIARADWEFKRLSLLYEMASKRRSGDEDDLVEGVEDHCEYEVGEFVTVRCGTSSTEITPFWLGRIDVVESTVIGDITLTVWWYELTPGQNGTRLCYTGQYVPMKRSRASRSDISSKSVLVYFPSLTNGNRLPDSVQRYTAEGLDPFNEN